MISILLNSSLLKTSALLFSLLTGIPASAPAPKTTLQAELKQLQHCPTYNKYSRKSFAHEYVYDAPELAQEFKRALGSRHSSFLFGASTSEHQCSKQCTPEICDWARFAEKKNLKKPTDAEYPCDLWNNYETYIDQLKEKVGINALRISIEWALIQPHNSESFDKNSLDHYAHVIAYLIKRGITPVICFHHYTSPCWFADQGGFEHGRNSKLFANYCAQTYQHIIHHLTSDTEIYNCWLALEDQQRGILWATFNSPEGVAFKGYYTKEAPAATERKQANGFFSRLSTAQQVLAHMCKGHVRAYRAIKKVNSINGAWIPNPRIGFLKNILQLDPAPGLNIAKRAATQLCCNHGSKINNTALYSFFTKQKNKSLDWIGLNYYSNQVMTLTKGEILPEDHPNRTNNSRYNIYPHGLFRAIAELTDKLATPLNIPIYVTENGVATQDHAKRNRFYKEYLHELLRAIQHQFPVYGYLTWTAFDNYEWPKTKESDAAQSDNRQYGLTTVSADGKILTLKEGAQYFRNLITSFAA